MTDQSRQVSNLLHNLRGEQFRHHQNVLRSRAHLASAGSLHTRNGPTLPAGLIPSPSHSFSYNDLVPWKSSDGGAYDAPSTPRSSSPSATNATSAATPGPTAPRSWLLTSTARKGDQKQSPEWRARALEIVLSRRSALDFPAEHPTAPDLPGQPSYQSRLAPKQDEGEGGGGGEESDEEQKIPPLTILCLMHLLSLSMSVWTSLVVPYVPIHLRQALVRYTAVHAPLTSARLWALYDVPWNSEVEDELMEPGPPTRNGADGEVVVVGPIATMREGYFLRNQTDDTTAGSSRHGFDAVTTDLATVNITTVPRPSPTPASNWDSDSSPSDDEGGSSTRVSPSTSNPHPLLSAAATPSRPPRHHHQPSSTIPIHTFLLLSSPLPEPTFLSLPLTLTRLGLIDLPSPIHNFHRLPHLCPLLVVLDISYNHWLLPPPPTPLPTTATAPRPTTPLTWLSGSSTPSSPLDRMDWSRWADLRVLGLRGMDVPEGFVHRINKGRWGDDEAVLVITQ